MEQTGRNERRRRKGRDSSWKESKREEMPLQCKDRRQDKDQTRLKECSDNTRINDWEGRLEW
jgi:hypothetical protein